MGNKAESSTAAALQDYYQNRNIPGAPLQRQRRRSTSMHALQQRAQLDAHAQEPRRLHGRDARAPQGGRLFQRRHQLRRHQSDRRTRTRPTSSARSATSSPRRRAPTSTSTASTRAASTCGMEDAIEIGGLPADGSHQRDRSDGGDAARARQPARHRRRDRRLRRPEPERLTAAGFARILEDNSSYYVLGYYPTNEKLDGRFRNVQVKVLKPGLKVRARSGYVAPVPAKKEKPAKGSPEERTSPGAARRARQPDPDQRPDDQRLRRAVQGRGRQRRHRRWRSKWTAARMKFTQNAAGALRQRARDRACSPPTRAARSRTARAT